MPTAILYSGTRNASSWAMRAWLALRAAGCDFEEIIVDIRRPQRFANLARIGIFSPSGTVPALVINERTIFDSLAIMEYANEVADGRLLPTDLLHRAQARSLMAWQHSGLSRICARISFESAFYPYKRTLTTEENAEASRFFGTIEPLLLESGGPFLFGEAGLADFMLTPTAIRLLRHDPDTTQWPAAQRWMEQIAEHPLVRQWMEEADREPAIWYDDYLLPDTSIDLYRASNGATVGDPPRVHG
jgi:glutathione S-transferase